MIVLINGRRTRRLDIADRGLQYGDGLFETWRWRAASLLAGASAASATRCALGIDPPVGGSAPGGSTVRRPGAGVLKIIVTRGLSGCGYLVASDATRPGAQPGALAIARHNRPTGGGLLVLHCARPPAALAGLASQSPNRCARRVGRQYAEG